MVKCNLHGHTRPQLTSANHNKCPENESHPNKKLFMIQVEITDAVYETLKEKSDKKNCMNLNQQGKKHKKSYKSKPRPQSPPLTRTLTFVSLCTKLIGQMVTNL